MRRLLAFPLLALVACVPAASTPDAGEAPVDAGPPPFIEDPTDEPPPVAWDDAATGTNNRDLAADFSLPLLGGGTYDLKARWTGVDSHLFLFWSTNATVSALWDSGVTTLLAKAPPNTQLVVLSYETTAEADVERLKGVIDAAIARQAEPGRSAWPDRIHYVTTPARSLQNWVGDVVRAKGRIAFGLDRTRHLRDVGYFADLTAQNPPLKLAWLANELDHWNFEAKRDYRLSVRPPRIVPLYVDTAVGSWDQDFYADVTLPSAEELAAYDTMELDLDLSCPAHDEEKCADWDYLFTLYLCDRDDTAKCTTELGRWVTPYKREGRWITDVTSLLPLLADGGARRFRVVTPWVATANLSLRFSTRHRPLRPVAAIPLYGEGGTFKFSGYNANWTPKEIEIPADVQRAEIVAFISGHGFGASTDNCAEFCNHTHHFDVNGADFVKDHPMAGKRYGCVDQVVDGVIPNQYGTWPYGRGGWCPGLDVKPFVVDVTESIQPGATNTIGYRGLYKGVDYVPQLTNPEDEGFYARIQLSSWLVLWK